jgi:excinuclease ABC subunit B
VQAVIAELETDMAEASGRLEFERAAILRDQINALRSGDFRKAANIQSSKPQKGKRRGDFSNGKFKTKSTRRP